MALREDSLGDPRTAAGDGLGFWSGTAVAARLHGPAAILGFAFPFALGASNGGYWPTAWSWSALALFWICAFAVLLSSEMRLGPLEIAVPAALLALVCWNLVSAVWGSSLTKPMLEAQLALVYAGGTLAAVLVVRRGTYRSLIGGAWLAVTLVSSYGLATRLFPERLGSIDDFAGYRLAQPLGYWNAVGIFAALGTLLALGFAARARGRAVRALAGASAVILVATLYFTFSRGAWVALAIGLLVAVAADRSRLQLVAVILAVAPWIVLAVALGSRSGALTRQGTQLSAASHAGHRYALELLLLATASAASVLALSIHVRIPILARRVFATALVVAAAGVVSAVFVDYGSPVTIARHAYGSFVGQGRTGSDLNRRLFSLSSSGRVPQWRVAWREYRLHPLLGSGSGSSERYWNQLRPFEATVRDAHNLYLETLAETGPVGLALLLTGLLLPLGAALGARRRRLGAVALGAYVAFLAHAAVDWDWEMPAVTITALFCAVALLAGASDERRSGVGVRVRLAALAGAVALAAIAFVGLQGNRAIAGSEDAAAATDWLVSAADARRAIGWAPWSARAWQLLGEAQSARHRRVEARRSFLRALARDREDWSIWLDLAVVSRGVSRRHAFAEAARLNPRSSSVATYRHRSGKEAAR